MLILIGIAVMLGMVLFALLLMPRRNATQAQPIATPFAVPQMLQRQASLREQQVGEDSAAIAGEYQRRADAAWLDELRARAALLLNATS